MRLNLIYLLKWFQLNVDLTNPNTFSQLFMQLADPMAQRKASCLVKSNVMRTWLTLSLPRLLSGDLRVIRSEGQRFPGGKGDKICHIFSKLRQNQCLSSLTNVFSAEVTVVTYTHLHLPQCMRRKIAPWEMHSVFTCKLFLKWSRLPWNIYSKVHTVLTNNLFALFCVLCL